MKQEQIARLENIINKDYSNMAGMTILKDGKCVYENYYNGCTKASHIHIFSVTKSIISILFGIALDKGYIDSIEQKVLDFYPEYTVKKGESLKVIKLSNFSRSLWSRHEVKNDNISVKY